MASYKYTGPFARITCPDKDELIALRNGQIYDFAPGSLPGLMDPTRDPSYGKLVPVKTAAPKKATVKATTKPDPKPAASKPD